MAAVAAAFFQRPFFPDAFYILLLTAFLDALDLSFGRIFRFARTLRFWLYFTLHYGLACFASYLLSEKIPQWYLLGFVGTFLGVSILSSSEVKIGGQSLVPIAQMFTTLKAQVIEQAAQDVADEVARAILIERLQKLPIPILEAAFRTALLAADVTPDKIDGELKRAKSRAESYVRDYLIHRLVKVNQRFAEARIADWEQGKV